MGNSTSNQSHFRNQAPSANIYRVGPNFQFVTIQSAITQAIADGHTTAANPALIEIYPGTYTENLTLGAGVHLKGVTTVRLNQYAIVVVGTLSYAPAAGTILNNVVNISGIAIKPPATAKALDFSGAGAARINVNACYIESNAGGAGTASLVHMRNTGTSSTLRMFDTVITGTNAADTAGLVTCDQGTTECYGGQGQINTDTGITIAHVIVVSNAAAFVFRTQNGINASATQLIFTDGATAVTNIERTILQNTLVGGRIVNFSGAGTATVRLLCSRIIVQDSTSKIAHDAGSGGTLIVQACAFSGTNNAPNATVDPGITCSNIGRYAAQKNTNNEFYVGRAIGYSTIQAAITAAAAAATGARKIVYVPPGNYAENLTLSPNVDLVADTSGFASNSFSPVTITGVHTLNMNVAASTINIRNIRFSSLLANATPLFTISGNLSTFVRFEDCFFNKSFAGTTSVFAFTTSANQNFIFNRCGAQLSADGGAMFDGSGATSNNQIVFNGQMGAASASGYLISTQTGAAPATLPFYKGAAGQYTELLLYYIRIFGTTARLFNVTNINDTYKIMHCTIEQAANAGEIIFYTAAGTILMANNYLNIGDAGGGGTKFIADGAAGVMQAGSNAYGVSGIDSIRAALTYTVLNEVMTAVP